MFKVQILDIITALRYMLMAEIPRKSVIKDEKLTALKLWVHAMKKVIYCHNLIIYFIGLKIFLCSSFVNPDN